MLYVMVRGQIRMHLREYQLVHVALLGANCLTPSTSVTALLLFLSAPIKLHRLVSLLQPEAVHGPNLASLLMLWKQSASHGVETPSETAIKYVFLPVCIQVVTLVCFNCI